MKETTLKNSKQEALEEQLLQAIAGIRPVDREAMDKARNRQDALAKPPGSLGGLEDMAVRMAGITGWVIPPEGFPGKGCVIVFCADNGVTAQGVSSAPQSVTRAQTINFTRRLTGVGALARSFGSDLLIVDMGVKDPIPAALYDTVPLRDTHKIIDRRIRPGTWDIAEGPAMTVEEAIRAMQTGVEMAAAAAKAGYDILGIGEMGIGNTTTSAAVLSALTGADAQQTCGRGGGVNDVGFRRKQEIVNQIRRELAETPAAARQADEDTSTQLVSEILKDSESACTRPEIIDGQTPDSLHIGTEPLNVQCAPESGRLHRVLRILARCGGFDLAAMTGAYLGAAAHRIPVVIDGYISAVAALAAAQIAPEARDSMFASHSSEEPGYALAIQQLGLEPFLALRMRLGEGSGCPIAFRVIQGACDVMRTMATFEEAQIDDGYLEEVRAGGCF